MKLPEFGNKAEIRKIVDDIRKRNRSAMVVVMEDINAEGEAIVNEELESVLKNDEFPNSIMAFNLAKLSDAERSRLFCRRLGYCSSNLLPLMGNCRS